MHCIGITKENKCYSLANSPAVSMCVFRATERRGK